MKKKENTTTINQATSGPKNRGNCLSMYSSVSCALRIHEYIRYYILLSSSYVTMGRTSRRSLMVPGPFSGENTYFYQDLVTLACACVSSSPLRWKTPHEGKLEKLRPQRRGSRYLPRSIAAAVYWFNDVNCRYFVFIGGGSGQRWGWWLESPNNIR